MDAGRTVLVICSSVGGSPKNYEGVARRDCGPGQTLAGSRGVAYVSNCMRRRAEIKTPELPDLREAARMDDAGISRP
jgi:hypothetical protein